MELLWDFTVRGALTAVADLVFDALAFCFLNLLQFFAHVLQAVVEIRVLELLLATLPKLLQEILQAGHPLAVLVLGPLAEEALQRAQQVALFQQIVTHRIQQRFGVQVQDVLRPVPGAVTKQARHGGQLR